MNLEELREIFDTYDRNRNGTIEASELKTAYAESGIPISDAEITVMIKEADLNLDGVVSFSEFVALFKKHQEIE